MYYFISDMHLQHKKIIGLNNRPFSDVDEMTKAIISNWNDVVSDNDTVYIIGDYYNGNNIGQFIDITTKLNGHKNLIKGNHDKIIDEIDKDTLSGLFETISDYKEIVIDGRLYVLCHYPIEEGCWKDYPNSIHLHGHIHSKENKKASLRYDVGVDANNYFPVSKDYILNVCKTDCQKNRHKQ